MRANIVAGKEPLEIGEQAIVGAGSLVKRSVSSGATAVGVPARELEVQKKRD
jgi:serine acetyltransferase